jgi:hypothetical protein
LKPIGQQCEVGKSWIVDFLRKIGEKAGFAIEEDLALFEDVAILQKIALLMLGAVETYGPEVAFGQIVVAARAMAVGLRVWGLTQGVGAIECG